MKVFKNGEFTVEYDGDRDSESIVKFMKSQTGLASKEHYLVENLKESLATTKEVVVVGLFSSSNDELAKKFHETANNLRDGIKFMHIYTGSTSDSPTINVLNKNLLFNVNEVPSVVLVKPTNQKENSSVVYNKLNSLEEFIKNNYVELISQKLNVVNQEKCKLKQSN